MKRPLSDYRLGRIIIWPFGIVAKALWFLFCVVGAAYAAAYAYLKPKTVKE
jgi:hypothetical protein